MPTAFDVLRGLILGVMICYGILRIAQINPEDIIFRYVGY
jgi:hypothetical protein